MARWPAFIGGTNPVQSMIFDSERATNLYVERATVKTLGGDAMLVPTPGFTTVATVPEVGGRGLVSIGNPLRMFGAVGMTIYEFDGALNPTSLGSVTVNSQPVQWAYNGIVGGQLGIASGGAFSYIDLATNTQNFPAMPTGANFSHLGFAGGFGILLQSTTGKVFLSALNDLSSWSAGQFFRRSLFADPVVAMFVDSNNLIWLLGTETFEVWYNTGTGTQPWAPLTGLVGPYGIAAPFAFALSAAGNMWVSRNKEGIGEVVSTRGGIPQSISPYGVANAIDNLIRTTQTADMEILPYHMQGHTFANIALPTANTTYTVDLESSAWATRGKWDPVLNRFGLWGPRAHCVFNGKHYIADRSTGIIAEMDPAVATELDGTGIVRERISPPLVNEGKRQPIDQIEVHMGVGLAPQSGQGSNPVALLAMSDDGGMTYGNNRQAGFGRVGQYKKRVYWTRCGAGPQSVAKVRITDPALSPIVDAWVNNVEQIAA